MRKTLAAVLFGTTLLSANCAKKDAASTADRIAVKEAAEPTVAASAVTLPPSTNLAATLSMKFLPVNTAVRRSLC